MKILILANHDVGLYKFRKEFIEELIGLGHEVLISLPDGEWVSRLIEMGCTFLDTPIDRRGMNPRKDYTLLTTYKRMLRTYSPDMVITYTIKPNIYGGMAAKSQGIPYCMNITGLGTAFQKENMVKKFVVGLYKIACRKAKVVFFENEGNRQVFLREGILKNEQTCLLNGAGVNTDEYCFEEYPVCKDTIRFLFVGRIMKEKGIEELVEAYGKLQEAMAGYHKKVELDIVGPLEETGVYSKEFLEERKGIQYFGFQEDVRPFIKKCHCFVLPSYHEGMANTLLEAGAMGRPLITSDIYGCKESICMGEDSNGFLVKVQDVEDLYEKMKMFVMLDEKVKEDMAKKSHEYIAGKFSKELVVAQTMKAIFSK